MKNESKRKEKKESDDEDDSSNESDSEDEEEEEKKQTKDKETDMKTTEILRAAEKRKKFLLSAVRVKRPSGCIRFVLLIHQDVQSTLPKSNPLGLKKLLRLRENSTYVGSKTIENKEKRT